MALEFAEAEGGAGGGVGGLEVVVADADPVVEALEGEVEVFVGFEFEDGEAAGFRAGGGGDAEEVQHAAVGGGDGGDLGVDVGGVEVGVDGLDVATEEGFEPALGLGAVEGVFFVSGRGAAGEEAGDEFAEVGGVFVGERGFVGSGAEGDFEGLVEGVAGEAGADAGELQAVEEEGEFGGGAEFLLDEVAGGVGDKGEDAGGGFGEAELCGLEVGGLEEAGGEVAVVGGVAGEEFFGGLVEFVEFPLGGGGVEPGEAGEGEGGGAAGDDEFEALVEAAAGAGFAAVVEPEDAEGEDAINGGLGLLVVDGDDGPGLLAVDEGASGVGGAEGFFEVHGGAEGFGLEVGEGAEEDAVEGAEVSVAGGFAGGGGAAVLIGCEFERLRFGLAEAVGGEAEDARAEGGGGDATDEVAVFGPEVEGAAFVLGGEGVFGGAEVEDDFAVFAEDGVGVLGEEGFERGGDGGGRLIDFRGGYSGRRHGRMLSAGCGLDKGQLKVERGDTHAMTEVEGVGVEAVSSGVEAEVGAADVACVVDEPVEHAVSVALGAGVLIGDEVVDVEGIASGEEVVDAEAGDGDDGFLLLEEGKVEALGLLGADEGDELLRQKMRAKLMHDGEAANDVGIGKGEGDGGHGSYYQCCLLRRWVMCATWWRECQP